MRNFALAFFVAAAFVALSHAALPKVVYEIQNAGEYDYEHR